jgi:predicted  nucleic acid-binding Zn-ribbon protein
MFSQSIGNIKDNVNKTTQMFDSMQKKFIRMESDIDNHGEKLKDHEDRINRLEGR